MLQEKGFDAPVSGYARRFRGAGIRNSRASLTRGVVANWCKPARNCRVPATVTRFYDEVVRLLHVDVRQAERIARAASQVAGRLGDDASRAAGLRAMGMSSIANESTRHR